MLKKILDKVTNVLAILVKIIGGTVFILNSAIKIIPTVIDWLTDALSALDKILEKMGK